MDDIPFAIIVNNVKKRQYNELMKKDVEYMKVVMVINSIKHTTPHITFIPVIDNLDEEGNAVTKLPDDVEAFIRSEAPTVQIPPHVVKPIKIEDFEKLSEKLRDAQNHLLNCYSLLERRVQPSTGKSTLINCLIGQQVFNAGVTYGGGLTEFFQKHEHNGNVYMDTPGLADRKLMKKAAKAITEALRQSGTYKLFFTVRLENGRVVADDLSTIETVVSCICPFTVIINNIKKRQYTTPRIEFIPTLPELDEVDNALIELPRHATTYIHQKAPTVVIDPENVSEVRPADFIKVLEELRQELEHLREDNNAMRRRMEELQTKKGFFRDVRTEVDSAINSLVKLFRFL